MMKKPGLIILFLLAVIILDVVQTNEGRGKGRGRWKIKNGDEKSGDSDDSNKSGDSNDESKSGDSNDDDKKSGDSDDENKKSGDSNDENKSGDSNDENKSGDSKDDDKKSGDSDDENKKSGDSDDENKSGNSDDDDKKTGDSVDEDKTSEGNKVDNSASDDGGAVSVVNTGTIGIVTKPANADDASSDDGNVANDSNNDTSEKKEDSDEDNKDDTEDSCFSCEKFMKKLEDLILETGKTLSEKECTIPEGCLDLPGPLSQGAVLSGTTGRAGHAIVNQYECSREGDVNYNYVSGNKESACDNDGERALPALTCIPTNCYLKVTNPLGQTKPWYGGDVNVTVSGLTCQKWSSNYPNNHPVSHQYPSLYPGDKSVEGAGNACRGVGQGGKPWCYTTDPTVRWEYCDVPECDDDRKCGIPPNVPGAQPMKTELHDNEVRVHYACRQGLSVRAGQEIATCNMADGKWKWPDLLCSSKDCFYFDDEIRGTAIYHGDVNTTVNGRICQKWSSQSPHSHAVNDELSELPGDTSLEEVGNKCRGGNSESAPWCYTTDPRVKLEYCNVPYCLFSSKTINDGIF